MNRALRKLAHRARAFLFDPIFKKMMGLSANETIVQLQLKFMYQMMFEAGQPLPQLGEVGFKAFSQTDEDGILLFIFSVINTTRKMSVEICAGNGIECNTANLIVNHGWTGLLVDGDPALVRQGRDFYKNNPYTHIFPPTFVHARLTRDNINDVILKNGFQGEIDLLSIDMDGMDYWIWQALDVISPRVVVVEYQDILGPEKSLTVPYSDDFNAEDYSQTDGTPNYFGASLPAFAKLARKRGYRLVGCNRYGYNAFFIRNPLGEKEIPEIPIKNCFKHPKVIWGMRKRFPTVEHIEWIEV